MKFVLIAMLVLTMAVSEISAGMFIYAYIIVNQLISKYFMLSKLW